MALIQILFWECVVGIKFKISEYLKKNKQTVCQFEQIVEFRVAYAPVELAWHVLSSKCTAPTRHKTRVVFMKMEFSIHLVYWVSANCAGVPNGVHIHLNGLLP